MFKRGLLTVAVIAAGISTASAQPYGFSDARSVGMGNVSVATGSVTTAAFSNPAMLMVNETDDTFALHIGVGVAGIEDGDFTDDIDRFQAAEDQLALIDQTNVANAQQLVDLLNEQIQVMNDLNGDSLLIHASPNFALVYGGDSFSLALSAEVNANASAAITNVTGANPLVLNDIQTDIINNGTLTFNPDATLSAIGAISTELGVSIASDFDVLGMNVSVGIRPKVVSAEAIVFNQTIATADTADIVDDTTTDLGSFTTADAGIVINFTDSLRVGVVAKNLISETLTSGGISMEFETRMRVGAAYNTDWFTIAADMDLTESDPILLEDPSKMLGVGIEFNAWDFMQLRAGYQTNLASDATADDLLSVGIGLWLGFNLDIAAVASEDSIGAFVQTGFRF